MISLRARIVSPAAEWRVFLLGRGAVAYEGQPQNVWARLSNVVGARRFELPTPCTPCRCATRLRYAPTQAAIITGSSVVAQQLPYFLQFLPDFDQVDRLFAIAPERV